MFPSERKETRAATKMTEMEECSPRGAKRLSAIIIPALAASLARVHQGDFRDKLQMRSSAGRPTQQGTRQEREREREREGGACIHSEGSANLTFAVSEPFNLRKTERKR